MRIRINRETEIDTERDLEPAERHVLQKLFGWKDLVGSVEEFRLKTEATLKTGWNNSGPVRAGKGLVLVIGKLEEELRARLDNKETLK